MTGKQLKARVMFWREILRLENWDMMIEVVTEFEEEPAARAKCLNEDDYDDTTLTFHQDWLNSATPEERDTVIVHELLHVMMRDFDDSIERIDNQLAKPVADLWHDSVRHERENLVDRLSKVIVHLHSE